ncbi:MAG: DNA polymerase III subunit delta' [Deltaproteobacteria bacterium]|nr:DNA polymerase III subunit delta' [Candidatus Anaeroferrophillus wilburensis]MBN2889774.1 DNA polymerase III subunit delta' [Deltaproteobacteria bacterium]
MSFRDVLGQSLAVSRLQGMIMAGTLPAALLLTGMEGVGKCFTAFQVAKALNCSHGHGDACDACADCGQISRRVHPDVMLVAAEKNQIKIDQIRELQGYLGYAPLSGSWKVAIIEDVHLLNTAAANALLKTLEEPPDQSLIMLVTHLPQVLLPTVLSRCVVIPFLPLSAKDLGHIVQRLVGDALSGPQQLAQAIALGGGSVSRSLFFLEDNRLQWRDELLFRLCSLTPERLDELFSLAEELSQKSAEAEHAWYVIDTFIRDALLLAACRSAADLFHVGHEKAMKDLLQKIKPDDLLAWRDELIRLQSNRLFNINVRLAWEALLLQFVGQQVSGCV